MSWYVFQADLQDGESVSKHRRYREAVIHAQDIAPATERPTRISPGFYSLIGLRGRVYHIATAKGIEEHHLAAVVNIKTEKAK